MPAEADNCFKTWTPASMTSGPIPSAGMVAMLNSDLSLTATGDILPGVEVYQNQRRLLMRKFNT